ncbi:LptF/LptG family permease [Algibacter pacificus]|uniref:LptF/LptG family permease n=1 Tax=Algibacter pacificus TaxID=2599389 RepID=UPI0011CCDCF2|nr:LptF/LptG family permease [Algibacter pacificus]
MKILDRYILTTYFKTFFSVFIILVLIFVLQTIWLYIKELAGKDLEIDIIAKFLIYIMPKLMPLVVPLTILLSSIMVFGSFAENYEFAAMKSTGISLQRAMSGLSIFIVALGIITFFFANNVIPWAEVNSYNLRRNIAKIKPAMAIAEGQFNPIEGTPYNIKVEKKSGENGQYLENVTIHLKAVNGRTNATIIKAKTGELASEKDSNVLKLILFNGNYYHDINEKDRKKKARKPFAKSTFEKYTINIDLSDLNKVDIDEQSQTDKYSMLDVVDLNTAMDSLIKKQYNEKEGLAKNLINRSSVNKIYRNTKTKKNSLYNGPILNVFNTKQKIELIELTLKATSSNKQTITQKIASSKITNSTFNRHVISFHEKFALGVACIILFFVGAPLGALIRKGGIGLPMVIAILLFLTYHFIGIFATNSAKTGNFNPVLASWFSTLVMLPLGIYLTKRATADKGIFEVGNLMEPLKKIFKIKEKNAVDYKFLTAYKTNELVDVIKNYETLGHDENCRFEALNLLKERGHSIQDLQESQGLIIDSQFEASEKIAKHYKEHSTFAISLYATGAVLLILFFVFKNNKLLPLATASIQLSIVSFLLYIIYYIKSIINLNSFYAYINKKTKRPSLGLLILGLPFYMMTYPLLNVKLKEDLKQFCLDSLK